MDDVQMPQGAIPVDQFQPAAEVPNAPVNSHLAGLAPEGAIPVDQFESHEDHYGSTGQMAKTFAEGVAEGVAGPLAPLAEKHILGVDEKDILARREENPISFGAGQATGLVGGALTGTGEAALMTKAGVEAAELVGLGAKAVEGAASLGFKVGSSAVQQAAEMAVLGGSDEVSKMILNDPDTSAESALANIGLAAAFGGAGGAFMTGAISPLWHATAGPKVEQLLSGFKTHMNGNAAIMPEKLAEAQAALGIEIAPELKAVLSGNPTAISHFNVLKEGQHASVTGSLEKLHTDMSASVAQALRIAPEEVAVYSENQAGHDLLDAFKREYKQKYEPIAEALEKRNSEAAKIAIADEARLDKYGKLLEQGMEKVGTDAPAYKLYNDWGNRVLAKETVGGIDMLKTELNGEIEKAMRAGDGNTLMALRDIRSSLSDFQESQIARQAASMESSGLEGAKKAGADLLNERAETNRMYKEFAQMSGDLTDHLGVGRFRGAGGLQAKLTDAVSAEQLLNKFSFKGNSDFIPFLQKNFPEVYEKVRENELKRLIKPAVLSAKGEQPLNIKKLSDVIEKGMAGQKEYVQALLPPGALDRVSAARALEEALPHPKSSGTAGWMTKMFSDMPRSAMAGVAMLAGHNPIMGAVIGEMAQRLGRDVPDALRLAHLKFLASDQPIKAEGFKAMVDFFHNTYKGETMLAKASKAVFQRGAQVVAASNMPNEADRTKLDKMVTKMQDNPSAFMGSLKGEAGHYLPNHQAALATASTRAMQYLASIKPQEHRFGPLDKPVPPQPIEEARYNRALDIAVSPSTVLQHVKDGTLQMSDIKDLNAMYPGLYKLMSTKLISEMNAQHSDEELIPYHTRVGAALFLGTPVDATMSPEAITAAQPVPKQPQQQQMKGGQKSMQKLGKGAASYMTPNQSSEANRANRD